MSVTINRRDYGSWLMGLASLVGMVLALFHYLTVGDGISFTEGALLVVVSSALILAASLLVSLVTLPRWLGIILNILLLFGLLGTALAAWFLQTELLFALMIVGLVGWLIHLIRPQFRRSTHTQTGALT